jgi:integrase
MARPLGIPTYRLRILRGRRRACVTIYDIDTHKRREVVLGDYDSPTTRQTYSRVLAEWERLGRRVGPQAARPRAIVVGASVAELCAAFLQDAEGRVSPIQIRVYKMALRLLLQQWGDWPAASVTPQDLRALRLVMLRDELDADGKVIRRGWCRGVAAKLTGTIKLIWKWGVAEGLVPQATYATLLTLGPLRASDGGRERPKVKPVKPELVWRTVAVVPADVGVMIKLQLLTGMRAGELCSMRPVDIDTSSEPWMYTPAHHKTEYRGKARSIYLGPEARETLRPYLPQKVDDKCFRRSPGDYGHTIAAACLKHGIPHWHTHQLRHLYATQIQKTHGLEAARILLGHAAGSVTEAVYVDRDAAEAKRIAESTG